MPGFAKSLDNTTVDDWFLSFRLRHEGGARPEAQQRLFVGRLVTELSFHGGMASPEDDRQIFTLSIIQKRKTERQALVFGAMAVFCGLKAASQDTFTILDAVMRTSSVANESDDSMPPLSNITLSAIEIAGEINGPRDNFAILDLVPEE